MKQLWILLGGEDVPSSRVRALAVMREMKRRGHTCRSVTVAGRSRVRIASDLASSLASRWDVVVFQKVVPSERVLEAVRRRAEILLFECDDALHLGYPENRKDNWMKDQARLTMMLGHADGVTVPNETLARELAPASGRVLCFPGPAPPVRRRTASASPDGAVPTVLWLGSSSTEMLLDPLREVTQHLVGKGVRCIAVGGGIRAAALGFCPITWTVDNQAYWLARATIGIMPMDRGPWNDRKSGYKLLEYLAAGVYPVASAGPAARMILRSGAIGQMVQGNCWLHALELSLRSPHSIEAQEAGYQRAEELSVGRYADAWLEFAGRCLKRNRVAHRW